MNSSGLPAQSLHCVLFSFGSNIKFTHLSSPSSCSPKSAVERLLRPLPSLLWNKPRALKGVASSLSKLRLNTIEWHSLALYTISFPPVLFVAWATVICELHDGNSMWRRFSIFYYLSLCWIPDVPSFNSFVWWQTVNIHGFDHICWLKSHQSIVQFVYFWHY